ncbi:MAG: hypothetical protein LQ347_006626, partial [Umbilicaria vellea]
MTPDTKKWRPTLNTIDSSFYSPAKAPPPTMTGFEAPNAGIDTIAPSAEIRTPHAETTATKPPAAAPATPDPLLTRLLLAPLL